MSKIWASKEWREKRAAYLSAHQLCEMPGCIEPATVIHHRVKANVGLAKWKEIRRGVERSKKNAELTAEQLTALTNEKYQTFKARVTETYLDFTPETVDALCKRCHYARDHGKVLCTKCGKCYHNIHYTQCYQCSCREKGGEPKPFKKKTKKS